MLMNANACIQNTHALTLFVVIAAFNESKTIGNVVADLRKQWKNVIVVDDGSSDTTAEIALAAGAIVLQHPINLGQGAALQTGIRYAMMNNAEYIVTFDADGQHVSNDIHTLLTTQKNSNADVVLGSRFLGKTIGMTIKKRLFLKAAILFTRLASRIKLTDTHNGLRLFTLRAAKALRIRQNRMAHASEIIDEIRVHAWKYAEAPVTIIYTDYSKQKGQGMLGSIRIVTDMMTRHLTR